MSTKHYFCIGHAVKMCVVQVHKDSIKQWIYIKHDHHHVSKTCCNHIKYYNITNHNIHKKQSKQWH